MAVPAMAIALAVVVATPRYGWTTVGLVNNYLGPRGHERNHWHFWFIEAAVQLCLVATAVLAVPAVRRVERRAPFVFALALLAGAVALRGVTWAGIDDPYNLRFRSHGVAAFFVLGWLVHRATTVPARIIASLACVAAVVGFFDRPQRDWYVIGGVLLLLWVRRIPAPRPVGLALAALASASMWIYLSHFHIWPVAKRSAPLAVAYPATVLAGVGIWYLVGVCTRAWSRRTVGAGRALETVALGPPLPGSLGASRSC